MKGHWTNKFSYVTGVVRYRDLVYFSLTGDDVAEKKISQSIIVDWDAGNWGGSDQTNKRWDTVGATIAVNPLEQALFLGEGGEILCFGSGDIHDETVTSGSSSPAKRGSMRGIRGIGDSVYAVGMNRQVYKRDNTGKWSCIDRDIQPVKGDEQVSGFEAVDGFSEKEIYTVGWEGDIYLYDGKTWSQKDSPTNFILVDVCCAGDGYVYACGRTGNLIRGRDDKWERVGDDSVTDDLWSMAWYQDKLYLSSMQAVYILDDNNLTLIDMGEDQPSTCFHLSRNDDVLWSVGAKDVMAFDGKNWSRID